MILNKYFNIDPKEVILIIIIILLVIFLFDTCNQNYKLNQQIDDLNNEIDIYSDLNSDYVKTIYKDSILIYSQKINLINESKARQIINEKYLDLKKTNNKNISQLIDLKTKTKIDFEIDLKDSLVNDSGRYRLKLPKYFQQSNKYYSLNGMINRLGYLQIDSLSINTNIILFESDTIKKGLINKLFRNKDKVLRINVDNPYVNISGFNNYKINNSRNIKKDLIIAAIYGITCVYVGYRIKQ
jgi:hypothetical protein